MKKLLFALVCAVTMISLSSCSKDEEPDSNNSLVGTWEYKESGSNGYYYVEEWNFDKKGNFIISWDEEGYMGTSGGTYTTLNNKLILHYTWDDDSYNFEPFTYTMTWSISNKKLTLIEPDGDTYIMNKKK